MSEFQELDYDEYQRAVAKQHQRDLDRFLGTDAHDGEARYDARDGSSVVPPIAEPWRSWLLNQYTVVWPHWSHFFPEPAVSE